jgi:hypothetical protein
MTLSTFWISSIKVLRSFSSRVTTKVTRISRLVLSLSTTASAMAEDFLQRINSAALAQYLHVSC